MPRLRLARPGRPRTALSGVAVAVAVAALFAAGRPTPGQTGPRPVTDVTGPASKPATGEAAADAADPPPPAVLTRVYDIRDLLVDIPNFTDAPDLLIDNLGWVIDPPSTYRPTDPRELDVIPLPTRDRERAGPTRQERADDIIRLIQETVAPDTWRETGGQTGAVRELAGQLIVTQTAEHHAALAGLLDQLREVQNINVRVRARWVLVADRADLDRVLRPATVPGRVSPAVDGGSAWAATRPASRPGGGGRPSGDAAGRPAPLLTASAADLAALPSALARYDAETVGVNGQRVNVGAVRGRTGSTGVGTLVTPEVVRVTPTAPSLLSGLLLDVQPTLAADRSTALLLVRAQWKEARLDPAAGGSATYRASAATRPAAGSGPSAEGTVPLDRRDGRTLDLRTAVRVPVGQTVLIGGGTLDPALPAAGDGGKSPPRLYLFVEVSAD
jgi:hypothetical protein